MYKILDRYILKKYIGAFLFVMFLLTLVICLVDYSEKSEDFTDGGLSVWDAIQQYYFYYVPFLANVISPLFVFISTIYVANRLASHTEIVAMLSSGMNMSRIMLPFVVGAMLIGGVIFYSVGWMIPKANLKRIEFELKYFGENEYEVEDDVHLSLDDSTLVYAQSFRIKSNVAYQFTLERIRDKQVVRKISTYRADWDTTQGKWKLYPYTLRTFEDGVETVQKMPTIDTTINLQPIDFMSRESDYLNMTLGELKQEVQRRKERSLGMWEDYEIEYYTRFSYPVAIIILTIMGFLVSARKSRTGTAGPLVVGFALAFVYYVLLQLGKGIVGDLGMPLWAGPWIPNLIFIFVNIGLYKNIPK